jgi:hypothetical protein
MAKMNVDADAINNPGKSELLPVEEEMTINGIKKMVPILYIAEITAAREHTSKNTGNQSLKLTLAIDRPEGDRVYVDDYLPYSSKASFKIARVVRILGLKPETLDTDDFEGQWIKVNLEHRSFTTADGTEIWNNSIKAYVDPVLPQEIPGAQKSEGPPF